MFKPVFTKALFVLATLLLSIDAYSIDWDNLEAMRGKLQSMTESSEHAMASFVGGQSSPHLDSYRSSIDRLRSVSNQVNQALLAKSQGDLGRAEDLLRDACRGLGELLRDSDKVLRSRDLDAALHQQFKLLRDDIQLVIDGIGCSSGSASYYEGRNLHSIYRTTDGKSVQAEIRIDGQQGWYKTSSFSGSFKNVRISDGGRTLDAEWSTNGQSGWVHFRMHDIERRRFSGDWGYRGDQHARGSWDGQG